MALATIANAADNPKWEEAMNGPNAEGFKEACAKEIDILEKMKVWDVVKRQKWMNVLPSSWAFCIKRFPDGLVRKLKARFVAGGHRQIHGVDFFDTFAPVVNWSTVRMVLLLTAQLELASKQVDWTAAFVHADIDRPHGYDNMTQDQKDRHQVYVEMPRGYLKPGHVLRLKKNLYGLKQAPRNWVFYLKSHLEAVGLQPQTDVDPCLYVSDNVICITYVDDCIMISTSVKHINEVVRRLREERGMDLEEEDDVAGFLGIHIKHDKDHVKLTQKGLKQ